MSGNEYTLEVYLGKKRIATLRLLDDSLFWEYTEDWKKMGYAVSPHLPLSGVIPTLNVQRFLRNLLPEGHCLEALLSAFHLSKYNTFGLVRALGLDISGALVMLAPEKKHSIDTRFRPISDAELETRLNTRDEFGLIVWDGTPRLSVAGVQDKINVLLSDSNQVGFAEGKLCSTHLLKFERKKYAHLGPVDICPHRRRAAA